MLNKLDSPSPFNICANVSVRILDFDWLDLGGLVLIVTASMKVVRLSCSSSSWSMRWDTFSLFQTHAQSIFDYLNHIYARIHTEYNRLSIPYLKQLGLQSLWILDFKFLNICIYIETPWKRYLHLNIKFIYILCIPYTHSLKVILYIFFNALIFWI